MGEAAGGQPSGLGSPVASPPPTVPDVLRLRLRLAAGDPALVAGAEHCTVADLDAASLAVARRLLAAGGPVGTVALWAPNSIEWAVVALGVLRAGGTVLPVSTRFPTLEAVATIRRAQATRAFAVGRFLGRDLANELASAHEGLDVVTVAGSEEHGRSGLPFEAWLEAGPDVPAGAVSRTEAALDERSPAFIQYTSGTTGRPKGAVLRHGALVATTAEWIERTTLRAGDRYAVVAPFFHISGYKTGLLASLLSGATAYPLARFDAEALLALIERERISVLQGPPTLYLSLLERLESGPPVDTTSLRLAITGGTVVPEAMIRRLRLDLGFETVITSYGLTEATGVVTACGPDDSDTVVARTSGRPIPSAEVRVQPLAPKEAGELEERTGEILVRSPHLMAGYLDDPAATRAVIDADGWLHTGDLGHLDDGGNLVITGRRTEMFIVGGFNVHPAEIESVLEEHPAVARASVLGAPDDRLGEVGVAFVVSSGDPVDEDALLAWCRERIAGYKVPHTVVEVEELPVNAVGKIDKAALLQRWASDTA